MVDTDGNGLVSLKEYEDVVIRSMKKSGIYIENN